MHGCRWGQQFLSHTGTAGVGPALLYCREAAWLSQQSVFAAVTGAGQYYHHTMQNLVMPTAVDVTLYFNTSSVDNTGLFSESELRKKIMINFTIPVFVFVKFNLLPY